MHESDLERRLYTNPELVYAGWYSRPIERWLARQYVVPSGVIDLLGVVRDTDDKPIPVIVELKNRPLRSEDVAQVLRYASDINDILLNLAVCNHQSQIDDAYLMLIGPCSPDNKVLFEADAANIDVRSFEVNHTIEVSGRYSWKSEYSDSLRDKRAYAATHKMFDIFRETSQ